MPSWTHLVRFIAVEDNREHLGQLVDTSRDIGLDSFDVKEIKVYLINGSIFNGSVTKHIYTVKQVRNITPASLKKWKLSPTSAPLTSIEIRMQLHPLPRTELHRPCTRSEIGDSTSSSPLH